MLSYFSLDTTQRDRSTPIDAVFRTILNERSALVIVDGLPASGKTTLARGLQAQLEQTRVAVEVVALDDELDRTLMLEGKNGLNADRARSKDLVKSGMSHLNRFEVTYSVFDPKSGQQTLEKRYYIPGSSQGVLIVEGLGASRVLSSVSSTIPYNRVMICAISIDPGVRSQRRLSRDHHRFTTLTSSELKHTLQRDAALCEPYTRDLGFDGRSTLFMKRVLCKI